MSPTIKAPPKRRVVAQHAARMQRSRAEQTRRVRIANRRSEAPSTDGVRRARDCGLRRPSRFRIATHGPSCIEFEQQATALVSWFRETYETLTDTHPFDDRFRYMARPRRFMSKSFSVWRQQTVKLCSRFSHSCCRVSV